MVDTQQEQVDHVEDDIRYSQAATELGLGHLQSANRQVMQPFGSNMMCAPINGMSSASTAREVVEATTTTASAMPLVLAAAALPSGGGMSLPAALQNSGPLCGPLDAVDSEEEEEDEDDEDPAADEEKSSLISLPRVDEGSSVSSQEPTDKPSKSKQQQLRSSPSGPVEYSESEFDDLSSLPRERRRRRSRRRRRPESDAGLDMFNCVNLDFPPIPKVLVERDRVDDDEGNPRSADDNVSVTPSMFAERDFRWSMPFETLRDDIRAVQKDILGLGKDTFRMMTSDDGLCHCGKV
jgi:hypothetical protein